MLCGSIVSGLRMQPGNWAGAYACWGTENREAAVRFVKGGPGTPHGAQRRGESRRSVGEPVSRVGGDPRARARRNPRNAALPPETTIDPAQLSEADRESAGIVRLPQTQAEALPHWMIRHCCASILGDAAVDMVVAVRRLEHDRYGDLAPNSWRISSGWRGACDRARIRRRWRSTSTHGVDRSARPRMLVGGGGPAAVRERPQRGEHRAIADSTRVSIHNSASRCAPIAPRSWVYPDTLIRRRIGNGAVNSPSASWRGCSCGQPASATGWWTPGSTATWPGFPNWVSCPAIARTKSFVSSR